MAVYEVLWWRMCTACEKCVLSHSPKITLVMRVWSLEGGSYPPNHVCELLRYDGGLLKHMVRSLSSLEGLLSHVGELCAATHVLVPHVVEMID